MMGGKSSHHGSQEGEKERDGGEKGMSVLWGALSLYSVWGSQPMG